MNTNDNLRSHKAFLTSQLRQLQKKKMKNSTDLMRAKMVIQGEKMGGIWSAQGKEKKPRNPIHKLKIPNVNPPQYECHSKRMAELA
jgi:hypothetical protein